MKSFSPIILGFLIAFNTIAFALGTPAPIVSPNVSGQVNPYYNNNTGTVGTVGPSTIFNPNPMGIAPSNPGVATSNVLSGSPLTPSSNTSIMRNTTGASPSNPGVVTPGTALSPPDNPGVVPPSSILGTSNAGIVPPSSILK